MNALQKAEEWYREGEMAFINGADIVDNPHSKDISEMDDAILSNYFWNAGYMDAKKEYERQQKLNEENIIARA